MQLRQDSLSSRQKQHDIGQEGHNSYLSLKEMQQAKY